MKPPTALLYDYLFQPGGGEYVTLLTADAFPAVDVVVASRSACAAFSQLPGNVRMLARAPTPEGRLWRAVRTHRRFSQRAADLQGYRQIVYSGMHSPFSVLQHQPERALLYCHTTPLPFVYDWYDYYLHSSGLGAKALLRLLSPGLRCQYRRVVASMDTIVANSQYVKQRYEAIFGCTVAEVIYPPCDLAQFRHQPNENFYLSMARLEPHKRVDVIVRAFLAMPDKQLVVASNGSQLKMLKRLADKAPNIHFTEQTDKEHIAGLLSRCIATIYLPRQEHFGLSAVESLASGKPVIAVAEGALPEILSNGVTGFLTAHAEPAAVRHAIELAQERAADMREACEQRARDFTRQRFIERMAGLLHYNGTA